MTIASSPPVMPQLFTTIKGGVIGNVSKGRKGTSTARTPAPGLTHRPPPKPGAVVRPTRRRVPVPVVRDRLEGPEDLRTRGSPGSGQTRRPPPNPRPAAAPFFARLGRRGRRAVRPRESPVQTRAGHPRTSWTIRATNDVRFPSLQLDDVPPGSSRNTGPQPRKTRHSTYATSLTTDRAIRVRAVNEESGAV